MTVTVERWEGAGNVYLLIDTDELASALTTEAAMLLVKLLGGDGVLELSSQADDADVRMRIWNPDGSQSEACGNGTRMVARWTAERLGLKAVRVATVAGVLPCVVTDTEITAELAPARLAGPQYVPTTDAFPYPHTFVSVGNPHVVILVADVMAFPLDHEGPLLEHHPWFPERVNVEIAQSIDRHHMRMRVWERGVGETAACGSGACAVAVAAVEAGIADSPVTVELPGGTLVIDVAANGRVTMHGPAERLEVIPLPAAVLALLEG